MKCLILNIHFDRFLLFDKAHFDKATISFWLFNFFFFNLTESKVLLDKWIQISAVLFV